MAGQDLKARCKVSVIGAERDWKVAARAAAACWAQGRASRALVRFATSCGTGGRWPGLRRDRFHGFSRTRSPYDLKLWPGGCCRSSPNGVANRSFVAADLVGPGGSVVGVDSSAEALARARLRAGQRGLGQVQFVEGDIHDPAPGGPYCHPRWLVRRLAFSTGGGWVDETWNAPVRSGSAPAPGAGGGPPKTA